MPKMKSKRRLLKAIGKTGSGKLKRRQAYVSHLAASKTQKQKRHLKKGALVSKSDVKRLKKMIVG